jgi:hypothetical protein
MAGRLPNRLRLGLKQFQRRVAEIRSGQVEGIPGEVTAAKIRRIVGR